MIIPSGYGQVNIKFSGTALPTGAEVTHGFKLDGSGVTPTDMANSYIAAIDAGDWKLNWHSGCTVTSVLVKFGPNDTGPSAEVPCSILGLYTANGCSPNVTFLIHKNTVLGGHAGKGRMFWPGAPDGEYDNAGVISPATVVAAQSDLDELFTDMDSVVDGLYLLHADGSPITTPTKVTGWSLDGTVATQRRRLRR